MMARQPQGKAGYFGENAENRGPGGAERSGEGFPPLTTVHVQLSCCAQEALCRVGGPGVGRIGRRSGDKPCDPRASCIATSRHDHGPLLACLPEQMGSAISGADLQPASHSSSAAAARERSPDQLGQAPGISCRWVNGGYSMRRSAGTARARQAACWLTQRNSVWIRRCRLKRRCGLAPAGRRLRLKARGGPVALAEPCQGQRPMNPPTEWVMAA